MIEATWEEFNRHLAKVSASEKPQDNAAFTPMTEIRLPRVVVTQAAARELVRAGDPTPEVVVRARAVANSSQSFADGLVYFLHRRGTRRVWVTGASNTFRRQLELAAYGLDGDITIEKENE